MSLNAGPIKTGETGEKAAAISVIIIVIVIVVLLIAFSKPLLEGIKKVLSSFGFIDTPEEKETKERLSQGAEAAAKSSSPWSPQYYKNAPGGSLIMTVAAAQGLAKEIWDSVGLISDTPEQGLAAIKMCTTKTQVSFVSYQFTVLYAKDLYTWLETKYDTAAQKYILIRMNDYVNSLPANKV